MYYIVASLEDRGAFVRNEAGKLFYSLGPQFTRVSEDSSFFREAHEGEIHGYVADGYILHDPPTKIEKLEDWPEAAARYEKQVHKAVKSGVHAAD